MKNTIVTLAALGGLAITTAFGDEVLFKSGDRLTGTVDSVVGGKMTFTSKAAGKVTLNMADIKTFSTDAPIKISMADGTVFSQKVAASDEGYVSAVAGGAAQPQPIALANVEKVNPEKTQWKGIVSVGATLVRGNTKSDTAVLSAEATRRSESDRTTLGAGYYSAQQRDNSTGDSSTTADNWFLKGQYDYFFSKQLYGYGNLKYEKDRIANLNMRLTPGVGLGYQWIEKPDLNFDTEAGFSYVHEEYSEPAETRTFMAGRLAYHVDTSFNDHVKAFHNLEYSPSLESLDTFLVNTDVGLRAAMTHRISLDAKAQMAYNSQPSEGRDKKDLRYILGVGWTF
jgi:putative salt-induced outer membrane protein YdiY